MKYAQAASTQHCWKILFVCSKWKGKLGNWNAFSVQVSQFVNHWIPATPCQFNGSVLEGPQPVCPHAVCSAGEHSDGCRILQLLTASQGCCWAGSFCQLCFHTSIKGHGRALLTSAILRSLRKAHHSLFIKDGVVWLCDFTICGNAAHKERYPGKVEICAIFTWRGVTLALLLQAKSARQTEQPYSSGLASRLVSPGTLKATLLWNSTDQPL